MKKVYSYDVLRKIEEKIPNDVRNALIDNGWNVFGIYELVKEELKKEKKNEINS